MIYICEYDDSAPAELLQQYAEHLPIPVYQGLAEGVKWKKYRERILAWLLFVYVVGYEKMKTLNIQRTALGKPYSAADSQFYFNISHCESACACIISDVPCGVDIEKKFGLRESMIRKICHPDEYDILCTFSYEVQEMQLRALWSLKESYVKMDGRGLGYGVDSVNLASLLPVISGRTDEKDGISYMAGTGNTYTFAGCEYKHMEIPVGVISEKELMGEIERKKRI